MSQRVAGVHSYDDVVLHDDARVPLAMWLEGRQLVHGDGVVEGVRAVQHSPVLM
eukprot:CAMPEP_0181344028 /NCGR_PEP_ID=MMETSP1101-20121128/31939_1 /TAXON_ID=46948 /ORGANISM="Rhodomonas abbreviata, Strain Caron Lab Isolate" /LENGTH=53 /DNA_ID=CAMNT_0023455773 /DNA_START=57 /DNA_END=218 /DNA_ORIENTATION=+